MAGNRHGVVPYFAVGWTWSALLLLILHVVPVMAQTCQPDGDINDDGLITPADTLLAFRHFLAIAEPPLTDCQQARANVNRPVSSPITPDDALCIFQQFLGLPSCFPAQPPDSPEIQFLVNTTHPLTVRFVNASGQPVVERQVTFQITAGDGNLSTDVVSTDADGRATTSLTVGITPGLNAVEARTTGLVPVVIRITGVASARGSAEVMGNTQPAPPGTIVDVPFVVRVEDEFGNPVAGVEVTVTVSGEGAEVATLPEATAQGSLRALQLAQTSDNTTAVAETNAQGEARFLIRGAVGTEDIAAEVAVLDQTIVVPIVLDGILLPNPSNTSPLITLPDRTAAEGETVSFQIIASDPDVDDELTFISADNLPPGLSIDPSGNVAGTVDSTAAQGSPYRVTVTVSDGTAMTSAPFIFMVTGLAPIAPVLEAIDNQTVAEGSTQLVIVRATDANRDDVLTLSAPNLPSFATLTPTGNGTATLALAPDFDDTGTYAVTLTVTDSGAPPLTASITLTITVTNENRPPVLTPIPNPTVDEGSPQSVAVTATDPDGDPLTLSAPALPTFATLTPTGNGIATLALAPDFDDAGTYAVTLTVTDGGAPPLTHSIILTITVRDRNRSPVLTPIPNPTVDEGSPQSVAVTATDPDGDPLTLSAPNLPPFATLTPTGNGTATLALAPDFDDAGTYAVTLTVTDSGAPPLTASITLTITVTNVNRPPVLTPIPNPTVDEGSPQSVAVTATDPDGDALTLRASGLPPFATLTPTGPGTLALAPDFDDAGTYSVTLTVTDSGAPPLTASIPVTITVTNVNRPPVLTPMPNPTVDEGATQSVAVTATDPDGDDTLTLTVTGLPPFAMFTDNGNRTGTLRLAPDFDDAGTYSVTLTVTDSGAPPLTASIPVTITVTNVNRLPVANAGEDVNVMIEELVRLDGSDSFDPDQDELSFSWVFIQVPAGSSIDEGSLDNPASPQPSFTPDVAGNYVLELEVSDPGDLSGTDRVTVHVDPENVQPNARITGPNDALVGQPVTLDGSRSDDGGDGPQNLTFNWFFSSVPPNSVRTDADIAGADSATASFTPDVVGTYVVTLEVFDGEDPDQAEIRINAMEPNVPPTANAGADIPDAIVGESVRLDGSGSTDQDGRPESLSFDWSFVMRPEGSELINEDIADTAISGFTPDVAGEYLIRLDVSDGEASSSDQVMVVARPAAFTLTVIIEPPGGGTVTIESGNEVFSCPQDCSVIFESNANVTLTANPDSGFTFSGWSGGGCSGTAPCTVTMDQDRSITANFALSEPPTISNISQSLLEVDIDCVTFAGDPFIGSLFLISFSYNDPNGDVLESSGAIVQVDSSNDATRFSDFFGDGFTGVIESRLCFAFGDSSSRDVTITLIDGSDNASNSLTINLPRPVVLNISRPVVILELPHARVSSPGGLPSNPIGFPVRQ